MTKVIELTEENFDDLVINSKLPVLVDFWAAWCGPCRMINPLIDELSIKYDGKLVVGKVNVDEQQKLVAKYGARTVPTVYFVKNGAPQEKFTGSESRDNYIEVIEELIGMKS
ncbi:MAG: Thioredoxin [uncultured Sulfurovum sp.]|uniref:Thioredoxin n=1 Tax=uncultured Sulfurovum sp. TaxID=269237 RepID=A0A6S6TMI8_9BACT|nr:MAG: Thioredoxin [uncultured Sulfurovum sp.]